MNDDHNKEILLYSYFRCMDLSFHFFSSRYLIAVRDIQPGEAIFVDNPFSVGASATSWPQCVGCFKKVSVGIKLSS